MSDEYPGLIVRQVEEVTAVELRDQRIVDAEHVQRVGRQLQQLIQSCESPRLLISFENVRYLSSSMLSALIQLDKLVRSRDGQLRLTHIDPDLKKMFTMTKLHKVLKICKDNAQAVASFD
ncbi:MAG: STAS domain-containing protein [Planctomycetota bacterium]|jgi:anti-sigma B factor antagonist